MSGLSAVNTYGVGCGGEGRGVVGVLLEGIGVAGVQVRSEICEKGVCLRSGGTSFCFLHPEILHPDLCLASHFCL